MPKNNDFGANSAYRASRAESGARYGYQDRHAHGLKQGRGSDGNADLSDISHHDSKLTMLNETKETISN